jgi:hypothetical protein
MAQTWHLALLDGADNRLVAQQQLDDLVLHALDDGRALYEKLGFVPTTEMSLGGGDV